jgi:acyl-coenzyme A thioesterase PaaI-like protein
VTSADRPFRLCGGCLTQARCRFGIQSECLDATGIAHFELACRKAHEAGPSTAHGGWTAVVMEELLGRVIYLNNVTSVAGELALRYERPVPVDVATRVIAN